MKFTMFTINRLPVVKRTMPVTLVLLAMLLLPVIATAEVVAVIGTGKVGSALGPRLSSIGHTVVYGSRTPTREDIVELVAKSGANASAKTPAEAARLADIILLAVPWDVAEEVLIGLGDLSGKIIIDPINPRRVDADGLQHYPTHVSSAERLQLLAPTAHVVKAFSTMSSSTMVNPKSLSHPVTIPLVGNDSNAKQQVAEMLEKLGFESIDFGPVSFAHIVEGLYLLRINARRNGDAFEWHFAPNPR